MSLLLKGRYESRTIFQPSAAGLGWGPGSSPRGYNRRDSKLSTHLALRRWAIFCRPARRDSELALMWDFSAKRPFPQAGKSCPNSFLSPMRAYVQG
jgi:hypothetical protein